MGFCVTPFGYLGGDTIRFAASRTAATIKQTVAVAQFSLNAYDAVKNYKKLSDISSRGIAIEEQQFAHVRDTYWANENTFLNEFTEPTPWETQAVLAKRYAGRMWAPLANAYAKKFKELECTKTRYCGTSYKRALQEMLVARSTVRSNIESLADRIAFYEVEQIRETDFERRKQAIVLRRGLVAQASALMASAAQGLASAGSEAMQQANQALKAIGYFGEQAAAAGRQVEQTINRPAREPSAPIENRSTPYTPYSPEQYTDAMSQSYAANEGFVDYNQTTSASPSSIQTTDVSEVGGFNFTAWGDGWSAGTQSSIVSGNGVSGMNMGDE